MNEKISFKHFGTKSFRIREWKSIQKTNETLVVGSSLLKDIRNEKYDCVSISGARVEAIADYIESFGEKIEQYTKLCLLLGGNNLHDWKNELGDSTLKVSFQAKPCVVTYLHFK